jgi:VanZ family protein
VASLAPGESRAFGLYDKAGHLAAYALLTFLGLAGFPNRRGRAAVVGFSLLLGICLELLQMAVGGREASFLDEAANLLGLLLGLGAHAAATRPRRF